MLSDRHVYPRYGIEAAVILDTPIFQEPPAAPAAPPQAEEPDPNAYADPRWEVEPEKMWLEYLSEAPFQDHAQQSLNQLLDGRTLPGWAEWPLDLARAAVTWPAVAVAMRVSDADAARLRVLVATAEEADPSGPVEAPAAGDAPPKESSEKDPWREYHQTKTKERDEFLAAYELPFHVRGVRLWREKSGLPRWHLLIERAPLRVLSVVKVPVGNARRDEQLRWLSVELQAGRGSDLVLCLYHEPTWSGRRMLAMKRTAWLDGPETRDDLPEAVRKYLLRPTR